MIKVQESIRQSPASLAQVGHWQGDLYLRFSQRNDKTVLAERKHRGPYTVQRSLYPEGGICHSILLHPPGGLVEGDELRLTLQCDEATHSLVTTPSAGKVYECSHDFAAQLQHFTIENDAILEWFPQEMILFNDSKSQLRTEIHLNGSARFIGWEMVCFGRLIANDHFSAGELQQMVSIYRDKKPLLHERTVIDASTDIFTSGYGMANYQSMGILIVTGANNALLEKSRLTVEQLSEATLAELQIGITLLDDVLVVRVLMNQSRFAKTAFCAIWEALRPDLIGVKPNTPRIWDT